MRPSSSPSEWGEPSIAPPVDASDPFAVVFGDPRVDQACGTDGWLGAMLDAERALAEALAEAELVPVAAAKAIGEACRSGGVTSAVFAHASSASPVVPLVNTLAEAVPLEVRGWVHYGATSQDIMDTAMMLVAHRATAVIVDNLAHAAEAAASLTERHRDTLLIGRTLGQHAAPTTFGAVAAGWLSGIDAARDQLRSARFELAAQLGGPVGTLEPYGTQGLRVLADFAHRLGLADPGLPWHTERTRVTRLASALATGAGTLAKVAHDVSVLGSSDVGELREGSGGGSSAMPHKHNPADSVLVLANVRRTPGLAATMFAALESELQRPAGAWQSEWQTLSQLLRCCGGASSRASSLLSGLRVDTGRMRSHLDATGGLLRAGAVADQLAPALGRREAHELIADLAARAETATFDGQSSAADHKPPGWAQLGDQSERPDQPSAPHGPPGAGQATFREFLDADPTVTAHLTAAELDAACDPTACLPAARALVDRALARHRAQEEP
ncbi:lyase family protein [Stackebrandtia nassauensis]|uniref:Fumarate lyase n=1 Tax=Stackebrandtia nassauensis (strain DSM 44728 / CIP 108903 / NRRL B-16338 / NBRC 102104 / LLR-40K-21) TaxID=446470 RepID=D3Q3H0_STANL|nr:lyase family protein [Stackebrandtia nassauensis]ADD42011.1 fumarate lyase [Stackebrandtia nassauensis DSM 44728]